MSSHRAIAVYCIGAGILGGIAAVATTLAVGESASSGWLSIIGTGTTVLVIAIGYVFWRVSAPIPDDK